MHEPAERTRDARTVPPTVYEAVGGQAFFDALVERFYDRVERDCVLRPVYPDDLEPGKVALAEFLGQYFGGPPRYSQARGHPRLRMRHAGFAIGAPERDAWLAAMTASVREAGLDPAVEAPILDYFENAAEHMVNQPGVTPRARPRRVHLGRRG